MRKIFVLLTVLLLTAQLACAKKLYVEMEYKKNSIKLDDGTDRKPQTVKGTDGKDLKFNSLIGALNYMSLQGWELVDTKSVTTGGGFRTLTGKTEPQQPLQVEPIIQLAYDNPQTTYHILVAQY